MSFIVDGEHGMDLCEQAAFAKSTEGISYTFNDSGYSFSYEAASFLVDALQSPHCRLTHFSISGKSACYAGVRCFRNSTVNFA